MRHSISVMKEQPRMPAGAHPMSPRRFERVQGSGARYYDSEDNAEGIRGIPRETQAEISGALRKKEDLEWGIAKEMEPPYE